MDRRLEADICSFISPVIELRHFLEEAYDAKQDACDLFLLSAHTNMLPSSVEAEYHNFDLKNDFVHIADCKPWTASRIFDGELQPSRFLPILGQRTFDDINDIKDVYQSLKFKTSQCAIKRNDYAKNAQRKSNYLRYLKYDKFDGCERELRRGHATSLSKPCAKDIIITCTVIIPHNKILSQEETRNTRLLTPERKLMLRGDSTLMSLRQKILCICDSVVALEDGHELEQIDQSQTHMILYPSSFIFIHDTFYIDYSLPHSQDISEPIREFMARKKCFDPVTSRNIDGVKIIDLKLRLGMPYVFQHSGTCEHLLIFHDLRILERADVQDLYRYPMIVYEKRGDVRCAACRRDYAAFAVEECERLPAPYMKFCDDCFREFFFSHGHKIGRFKAHPYMPINRFTII